MNLLEDPTQLNLGRLRDRIAAKKRATDNNPNSTPDPMTARTSPTWDNNPNHKPDPMNLHHTGAYSLPSANANVQVDGNNIQVDVNAPVVPTQNLLGRKR